MKTQIIILSNQKGGVGKTTVTRELAFYIASRNYNVLIVDCDPQGNLTKSLTEDTEDGPGLYESLTEGKNKLTKLAWNLYLLKGDYRLSLLEKSLIGEIDCYTRLKTIFREEIFNSFNYIFLDTPPSLGVLTINALTAASNIIIPMNPSLYSMQGVNDLFKTISKVKENLNPNLSILGVIINSYESIPVITRQIKEEIIDTFGDKVFKTVLSKSIKIEEAIALKKGVIFHKNLDKSRAKEEVAKIGDELLTRIGGPSLKEAACGN